MYIDANMILEQAEDIGDGWKKFVAKLEKGDTAESGVSTKWVFAGPGQVTYLIHPSGWTIQPDDKVRRTDI